ncbi:MAG TPA: DUF4340 domain-containing protein [Candidatus Acidoferrales bacterium]|nr:DUF4340 domain-containing protein [Candidatus Acidoferrales bacterium]
MIKKSTLIFLLCAVILGGVFYYLELKKGLGSKPAETAKSAFSVPEADISSLTLTHPAKPDQPAIRLDKTKETWQIVEPMVTAADQPSVQGLLDNVTTAKVSDTTEPATPDRLKVYGLTSPQFEVEFQLKNGAKHTLQIGNKDFTGNSIYAIVDGGKTVSLLPVSVLTGSDKSLDDLRDHAVLHLTTYQVASFTLKNPSGELELTKSKDQWKFTKPSDAMADQDSIDALFTAISNAKLTSFVSEKPEDLGKYGLANPAINFTFVDDTGKKSTLLLGKKDGNEYFARDTSRPSIFRVGADLYTQLAKGYGDLRDKKVLHFDSADITRVEIHNDHGTIAVNSKSGNQWVIDSPDQKGKTAASYKIFDPLTELRADQVIDHPEGSLTAKLAKPAIEVVLTDKNGKTLTLKMSNPTGDVVYAQASDSSSLCKLKKQDFDNLNFQASSLLE